MDFVQGRDPKALSYENTVIVETRRDKVIVKSVSGNTRLYELPFSIFKSNGLEYGLEFLTPGTVVTLITHPNGEIRGELKGIELYPGDINSEQEGLLTVKFIKGGREYLISQIPTSHVVGYQSFRNVRKVKVYILNGDNYKFVAIPPETYLSQLFRGEETPGFLPESPSQPKQSHSNISTPQNQHNPFTQFMNSSAAFQNSPAQQSISNPPIHASRDIQPPRNKEAEDASNLEDLIEYSTSLLKQFYKLIELQIKSKQSIQSGQSLTADQLHKTVKKFSELPSKFQLPHSNKIQKISKKHKKLTDLLASDDSKVYLFNLCQLCKFNMTSITLGCGHSICNSDLSSHIMNTYTIQRLPEEKYLLLARCNLCDYNLTETELSKVLDRRQFGALMETLEMYKINEQRYIAANKSYCGVCYQLKYNQEFGYVKGCNCRICRNCFMSNTSGNCTLCNLPSHSQLYSPSYNGLPGQVPASIHPVQSWQSPTDNIRSDLQIDQASKQGYNQPFNQPIQDQHLKTSTVQNPLLASQKFAKDPISISSQSNMLDIFENKNPTQAPPQMTAFNTSERFSSVPKQRLSVYPYSEPKISQASPAPKIAQASPAPKITQASPAPKISQPSPAPISSQPSHDSKIPQLSPAPQHEDIPGRTGRVSRLISLFNSKSDAAHSKGSSLARPPLQKQASKAPTSKFNVPPHAAIQNIYMHLIEPYIPPPHIHKEERKVICSICQNDFKLSEIVSLYNCEHKFCKEDLRQYTLASIENDQITKDGLKCPDLQCKNMIEDVIMENIFRDHDKEWTLYNRIVMAKRLKITYCPVCNAPIEYVNRIATCFNDGHQFCIICNEGCHEGTCDKNSLIQRTKDMMQIDKVAQCPGCMIPCFKDSLNCDHVKCRNESCGVEFCFDCACVRSPTLAHGNHYHRPQCNWYRPNPHPDQYLPNQCPVCKNLGGLCPRPKDLETKGILTGL